jgi:hypothetical protein
MQIPFTAAEFFDVFREYNEGVWPIQLLLMATGLVATVAAFRAGARAGRLVSGILAVLWLWMGAVYHISFFRVINPAAPLFGALFIVQGGLIAWLGAWKGKLTFGVRRDLRGVGAALLIVYALALYPMVSFMLGHRYPAAPTFGLPCPTTIFTLGLLLGARAPVPRSLVVIPALWAVVGTAAALELGVSEDFGLLVAGVIATPAVLLHGRREVVRRTS